MNKLLILCFILFPSILFAQSLSKKQLDYLKTHSVTIDRDRDFEDGHWDLISHEFQGKELALLGEFNHGSKEVFEIRNSLIQYLHQKHNFDVILFEAGIGELISPHMQRNKLSPEQMTYGFFGIWRTQEFVELMRYIRDQNIKIAGFDVQRSGSSFNHILTGIASQYVADSTIYLDLEDRFTHVSDLLREGREYNSLKNIADSLIADYRMLYDLLAEQIRNSNSASTSLLLAVRTLLNRIAYLEYFLKFNQDRNWSKRWSARDSIMADNIKWISQKIFKNKKIIIIGHNFHTSRYNEKENTMGEILDLRYGDKMYSLGTFAGSGSYANNAGKVEYMLAPDSSNLDIKHIISSLNGFASFLDLTTAKSLSVNWLNEKIIVNDTFIDLYNSNKMALPKHFDGLLLLKSVSPPER